MATKKSDSQKIMNNTGSTNTPRQIIYTKSFKVDLSGASGNRNPIPKTV